jgi:hypothetical protein
MHGKCNFNVPEAVVSVEAWELQVQLSSRVIPMFVKLWSLEAWKLQAGDVEFLSSNYTNSSTVDEASDDGLDFTV